VIWLRTENAQVMEIEKVPRQNCQKIIEILETGKPGVIEINSF
jgi:predicted nuclease of predicted toxin-antitoxin system